ncbi:MAG: response regulator [Chloroflexi bacterium]|nr:response regulator [Chloroflexota bacterium]
MSNKKIVKKILIADDEPNIRLAVRRMLSQSYEILEAGNGQEAIGIARARKPDLILMDVMMPGMDGYAACSAIKNDSELKKIPVVMLTALGFQLNKGLAAKLGADDYITKPFSQQDLLKAIDRFS